MSTSRQKLLTTLAAVVAPLALVAGPAASSQAAEPDAAGGRWVTVKPGYDPSQIGPGDNRVTRGGIDGLGSNRSTYCAGKTQPGTIRLKNYLQHYFPTTRASGLYNCRKIANSNEWSLHAEGRAVDHFVNVNNAAQKKAGDAILYAFTKKDKNAVPAGLAQRWGVQEIIWNCKIWTAARADEGVRAYGPCSTSSSPTIRHEDHVHIAQHRVGAAEGTTAYTGYQVWLPDAV